MKISKFSTLVFKPILLCSGAVAVQEKPDVLSGTFAPEKLKEILLSLDDWHPFQRGDRNPPPRGRPITLVLGRQAL
ncbi:MAG: hypothetical protein MUP52_14590 [Candidatus Aminicenantes bacterium]|nr:hypothetical protein [Candidatus Aminicenantes bacterium]